MTQTQNKIIAGIVFFLFIFQSNLLAQGMLHNSIKQIIPKTAHTDASVVSQLPNEEALKTVTYSDGLGRPIQNIVVQATDDLNGYDLVQPIVYDAHGNHSTQFLPYVSDKNNGSYQSNFDADQFTYYNNGTPKTASDASPRSETMFESSPFSRVVEQTAPGVVWQKGNGHTSLTEYHFNSNGELTTGGDILQWTVTVDAGGRPTGATSQSYGEAKLYKTVMSNENGKTTIIYKDMNGKTVCIRTDAYTDQDDKTYDFTNAGTGNSGGSVKSYLSYYVYDIMGRPVFYIPAGAYVKMRNNNDFSFTADETTNTIFKEFVYAAYYDKKGRKCETYVPRAGRTNYIYNLNDQVILMQDADMDKNGQWLYAKYDALGRVIKTGMYDDNSDPGNLQVTADNQHVLFETRIQTDDGYTNDAMPQTVASVFTINYFDTYDFSFDVTLNTCDFIPFGSAEKSDYVNSLPTASKVNVLGTTNFLNTKIFYNAKGQPIQTHVQNLNNGWDVTNVEYNFNGQPLITKRTHTAFSHDPVTIKTEYNYDHTGRLIDLYKQVNSETRIHMVNNEFNGIGQLVRKNLHSDINFSSSYMQRIDYRYNIRGWLTSINNATLTSDGEIANDDYDDVFGQELFYNNSEPGATYFPNEPQYNGNISYSKWRTQPYNNTTTDFDNRPIHSYTYRYDDFNRLTAGYYAHNSTNAPDEFNKETDAFTEKESYDIQGNIQSLQRYVRGTIGAELIDNLTYTYTQEGNQLNKVSDAVAVTSSTPKITNDFKDGANTTIDYTYDDNGSLLADLNKGFTSIAYNYLKQPQELNKGTDAVNYVYDATGRKLKMIAAGIEYSYNNGIEYTGSELQFITTEEGRIRPKQAEAINTEDYVYDYFIKDYLGNVRVTLTNEQMDVEYMATMEDVNDNIEKELFENVPETRDDKPANMPADATYSPDAKVSMLNPAIGKPIGHAKVLEVQTGDKINVDTKYYFTSTSFVQNNPQAIQTIVTQLAGAFFPGFAAGTLSPEGLLLAQQTFTQNSTLTNFLSSQLNTQNNGDGKPLAFLTWLMFDKKFNLVADASGVLKTEDADQLGNLAVMDLNIPVDGYIYIYVSNESINKDVSFDNLKIDHVPGNTMEENHYYPYGLLIQQLSTFSHNGKFNKYKYQDKEMQNALGMNMLDFGARHYDAVLGRWNVQDPVMVSASPYLAMGDNPVSMIDPDGMTHIKVDDGEPFLGGGEPRMITHSMHWYYNHPGEYNPYNDGKMGTGWSGFVIQSDHVNDIRIINSTLATVGLVMNNDGSVSSGNGSGSSTDTKVKTNEVYDPSVFIANCAYVLPMVDSKADKEDLLKVQQYAYDTFDEYDYIENNLEIAFVLGTATDVIEEVFYSRTFNTWLGKDGKLRSQKWGGNGTTGGKNKFAKNVSNKTALAGKLLGFYELYTIRDDYSNNKINKTEAIFDGASSFFGTFGGVWGASWSFGWSLGREYGPSGWYGEDDTSWFK